MAVDYEAVDAMASSVADIYAEAERAIMVLITSRLQRGLDTSDWARRRLAEIGVLRRSAAAVVAGLGADSDGAVRRTVAAAYSAGNDWAVADLADAVGSPELAAQARMATPRLGGAVQALADAVNGELRPVHSMILPQVDSAYRRAIAGATARTLVGGQNRRRAAQAAWSALVDKGIVGFVDSSGRTWRLHSYVEVATRTAALRAEMQGLIDGATASGQRFVYVVDNPRECEICAPWETKVLALWGAVERPAIATLEEARAAGLHHPNCRHRLRIWLPGISRATPARTADPDGYADEQRQRYIERQLRHWRERQAAAFDPAEVAKTKTHVAAWDAEMRRHIEETGLKRLRFREKPGAGHEAPASRRSDRADLPVR